MLKTIFDLEPAGEIRAIREAAGLTQEDFAQIIGLVRGTVQNWENGRTVPSLLELAGLRALFPQSAGARAVPAKNSERKAPSRYREETVQELHQALDMIIDKAPSEMVKTVGEFLTIRAGKYGGPTDRPEAQDTQTYKHSVRRARSPNNA